MGFHDSISQRSLQTDRGLEQELLFFVRQASCTRAGLMELDRIKFRLRKINIF
ncbi:MAG: hypothetical protein ACYTG7_08410 [Planctomycetota bacterium]